MTQRSRRTWLVSLGLAVAAASLPATAEDAKTYPSRPITVVVGFPAGGGTDLVTRALADALSKDLRQPVLVENRPGAASSLSIAHVASKEPDGYTIGLLSVGALINQHMRKVSYDTSKDLTPILQVAQFQAGLLVKADAPWKNLREFLSYAKENPGRIRYSTAGVGSQQHLVMVRLAGELGIKWTHVPYQSTHEVQLALQKGEVNAMSQTAEWTPGAKDGRFRLLAVYGEKRMADFPETPTLIEAGFNITTPSIIGYVGPKGMNPDITEKLHQAFKKAMEIEQVKTVIQRFNWKLAYQGPEEFRGTIEKTNATWGPIVREHLATNR